MLFHILVSPGGLREELIFNQLSGREKGEQRYTTVYSLLVINQLQTKYLALHCVEKICNFQTGSEGRSIIMIN